MKTADSVIFLPSMVWAIPIWNPVPNRIKENRFSLLKGIDNKIVPRYIYCLNMIFITNLLALASVYWVFLLKQFNKRLQTFLYNEKLFSQD